MTKEDLKYGNVVELRNGDKYLVIRKLQRNEMRLKSLDDGVYEIAINEFDSELKYETYIDLCCNDMFDIVKIYKDYTLKDLLWERKEKPHLTNDEKTILSNIDKCFKYIARNENGILCISAGERLFKISGQWHSKCYYSQSFPYTHLFKFIKWEDHEPYLIEDLLKEE